MISDDSRYILRLISEGEHQQQDFKYKITDAMKLARSVSAFANTDGGRLLIGVRDDGAISGVRSEEEIYMMHAAAYEYCRPASSIKFDTYYAAGRNVVIATVPPALRKPVCAHVGDGKYRAFIRIADENIIASPVQLRMWKDEQSKHGSMLHYTDEESAFLKLMGNSGMQTLNQIVRRSGMGHYQVIALLSRFIRFGLVRQVYDGDGRFLFGTMPETD